MIRLVYYLVGTAWASALLVTNSLSFVFPILVYKTFGYRTALLAELFPTYLVFTTVAYSDVIALVLLALSLMFLMKDRLLKSSIALSGAIMTFFNLAWTLPSFLLAPEWRASRKLLFCSFPFVAGGLILLWFKVETGDYLSLLRLESPWGVGIANPLAQAYYLLCIGGQGSFTCQNWEVLGISLTPTYWLVRNLAFEAFYLIGALYLLKTQAKFKVFLSAYCVSVTIPLLFFVGVPAMSVPRLLLPAFPVFVGYSNLLKGRRLVGIYFVVCLALAATVSIIQYFALFA